MDLLDGSARAGLGPCAASSAALGASLLLLHTLLLHYDRDFSLLAQLQLLALLLTMLSTSLSRGRRLRWDQRTVALATLDGARRLALLWLRAQSLRRFGLLFAFLVEQAGVLLPPLRAWTAMDKNKDSLLLLLGLLLVAGVNAQEYGSLLHALLLLLGARMLLETAAETLLRTGADDDASSHTLLVQAAVVVLATALGMMTPESIAMAQRVANDRATEDGGVMTMGRWTVYMATATMCQVVATYFQQRQRFMSIATREGAQLVSIATGMVMAIAVSAWEGTWLKCVLDAPVCGGMLYVLIARWRSVDGGVSSDSDIYLDTYRPGVFEVNSRQGSLAGATHILSVLWAKRASRQLLLFLSVNVAFMFVELGVGLYTNSLGLMGDAGHMLFDNGALVIGLVASYIGQLPPDADFTYGYGRVEVLSGFLNSLLLLVVSFHLLTEAATRFMDPPEVSTDHLLLTSTAGLVVNLVGLFCFHDHVHGHSHSHPGDVGGCGGHNHSHGNSHHQSHGEDAAESGGHAGNSNMYGVYLHVLADTLGSVGVIVSSILIQMYGWHVADSVSSALISLLILGSTLPLLKDTAQQLLQGAPQELQEDVNAALRDVQLMPGVERIAQWNIWRHAGDVSVATLHLEVASSADEQRVLQQTRSIFQRCGRLDKYLSVQISKPQVIGGVMERENLDAEQPQRCTGHSHGGYGHSHDDDHGGDHFTFPIEPHPRQPTGAVPVTLMMSTHENPAGDDSQYLVPPPVKPHAHSHGLQFHQVPPEREPPIPFQRSLQQRQHQASASLSGPQRW